MVIAQNLAYVRGRRLELLKSGSTTFSSILGGSATAFPAFKVSAQKGLF
ncbi:hypothetical protein GARC_1315 [Paraglaciecola arctica BSs20135]|uniref:Uncharacterized protein n=1 Tax=Paraglaciecola arctica BSs20135 TaxID=493475 RepID=K6Y302_9ALTE|nr:hypothetical protein GARC_1315 [Paraglaciecola arctica BSs20135]